MLLCSALPNGPLTGSSADPVHRVLRVGVSSCCSSPCAHRALISFSTCFPYRFPSCPACFPVAVDRSASSPSVMLCPGIQPGKVRNKRCGVERTRDAQCARERPPPLRQFEACQAGMQVRAPARLPRSGVGHDTVPGRHQAKQAGLCRAYFAANTGAFRVIPRLRLLSSRDHLHPSLPRHRARIPVEG